MSSSLARVYLVDVKVQSQVLKKEMFGGNAGWLCLGNGYVVCRSVPLLHTYTFGACTKVGYRGRPARVQTVCNTCSSPTGAFSACAPAGV